MTALLASVVHSPVAGFQTSAAFVARPSLMLTKPPPLVPPVTSTWPSGRIVEFRCRRETDIGLVFCQAGDAWLRSMTSAVAVGSVASGSGDWPQPVWPPPPA